MWADLKDCCLVNKNQPDRRQDEKLDVDLDFVGLFHAQV